MFAIMKIYENHIRIFYDCSCIRSENGHFRAVENPENQLFWAASVLKRRQDSIAEISIGRKNPSSAGVIHMGLSKRLVIPPRWPLEWMLINHYPLRPFPPDKHTSDRSAVLVRTQKNSACFFCAAASCRRKGRSYGGRVPKQGRSPCQTIKWWTRKISLQKFLEMSWRVCQTWVLKII